MENPQIITHDINTITEAVLLTRKMIMKPPQKWTIGKAFFQQIVNEIIEFGKANGMDITQEQAREALNNHNYTTDVLIVYKDKTLDEKTKEAEKKIDEIADPKVKEQVEKVAGVYGGLIDIPIDLPVEIFAEKAGQTVTIRISLNFKSEIK